MSNNLHEVISAIEALLKRDMNKTCQHQNTHRGGALWTICDDCGMGWADDQGGMPEWVDPPEWQAVEKAIDTLKTMQCPGGVQPMTDSRAVYFMERFLHEEKMLGPNEQASLHYVIDILNKRQAATLNRSLKNDGF